MKQWMLSFALISLVLTGVFGGDFLSPLYTKHKVAIIFSSSQNIAQFEAEKVIKP
jgi:hypothetical protein